MAESEFLCNLGVKHKFYIEIDVTNFLKILYVRMCEVKKWKT